MQMRRLGQSGIEASAIGFGAWAIGGWTWGGADVPAAVRAVHAALDHGINLIDTAPMYGFGLSEDIVGKAIAGRRDRVVLATKCGMVCDPTRGRFKGRSNALEMDPNGHITIHGLLSPDSVRGELEASLRRLQTDCIDLYQTHWPDTTTPIEETMAVLLDLKQEGKIRAIGASNVTPAQMDEYRRLGPLDADQERYSMLDRQLEAEQLPYCRRHEIAVLAYSPLAQGLLTDKAGPEREFPEGDQRRADRRFSVENRRRMRTLLDRLRPVAEEHGISLAQLAAAWAFHQPGVTHALVGIRNSGQAEENAAAGSAELNDVQLRTIRALLQEYAEAVMP